MSYNQKKNYYRHYPRANKYDKSYNTMDKLQEQIHFRLNNKFLLKETPEKIENFNKNAKPYYPLPSNDGYEFFLKTMKKEQYLKTQYSIPFMLSLKEKYYDIPPNMNEIKIPQKNEIRSRAKIVTEEAYRVTRNYLDENTEPKTFTLNYFANQNSLSEDKLKSTTKSLREILNKISYENYDECLMAILKFEYDENLLNNFKNLIFYKILTESKYFYIYVNICSQMCKLYSKKTYGNEPKMHLRSLLLNSIQREFLSTEETYIKYPFPLNEEDEKPYFIFKLKRMNIKLIAEFYLSGIINKKIIEDCITELITKTTLKSITLLYDLIKIVYKKLIGDSKEFLDKAFLYFDHLDQENKENIQPKIKCFLLEILEIKEQVNKLNPKIEETNIPYTQLGAFPSLSSTTRKSSEVRSRKSSINPKDVEYIRRSRFNSISDELKVAKEDNKNLMDELVNCLGADLDFYQCFRLTEEEFDIIKEGSKKFFKYEGDLQINKEQIINDFNEMMEEVQCEKFIAVGHLLEFMFSLNSENAEKLRNIIIAFFKFNIICDEDIKHGMVLGLVNFKNNIIDYPNTKDYFQKFITLIKDNQVMNEKLIKVYQRTCDNLAKSYE